MYSLVIVKSHGCYYDVYAKDSFISMQQLKNFFGDDVRIVCAGACEYFFLDTDSEDVFMVESDGAFTSWVKGCLAEDVE